MEAIFSEFFSEYMLEKEPVMSNPINEEFND
jgi:hypothetical protein